MSAQPDTQAPQDASVEGNPDSEGTKFTPDDEAVEAAKKDPKVAPGATSAVKASIVASKAAGEEQKQAKADAKGGESSGVLDKIKGVLPGKS